MMTATTTNRSTSQSASVSYSPKGGPMSKTSATRSVCAALLVAALALFVATPSRADLVLQLSTSMTGINTSETITGAGTYTVYLYAEISTTSGGYSGNAFNQIAANIVSTSNTMLN